MRGRLTLFTFVNVGRLVEALRKVGLDAEFPNSKEFFEEFIPISKTVRLVDGSDVVVKLGGVYHFASKIGYQCWSLSGFVRLIEQVANTVTQVASEKTAAELFGIDGTSIGA